MAKTKDTIKKSNKDTKASGSGIKSKSILNYKQILNSFESGYAYQKIIVDNKGNAVDFEYIEVNPAFEKLMGLKAKDIEGKRVTEVIPDFKMKKKDWIEYYGEIALNGKSKSIDFYSKTRNKWLHIRSHSPEKGYFITEINDITKRKDAEMLTVRSNQQLNEIVESISDAFVALDKNWCYTYMNKRAGEIFARDPKEIIGKHIWTEFPEGIGQPFHQAYEKALREHTFIQLEEYYPPYDKWFENRIYPTKEGLSIFFHDITERKNALLELKNVNRTYAVISQINQLIVRESDINEIFRKSCKIAIEYGKFRMAWIGIVDEKTRIVNPKYWDGHEDGYLSSILKIALDNKLVGKGPTATAINEGKHYFCNDIANDPVIEPWREEALKRDYRSSIALPLKLHNKVIGSFNLYSEYKNFFNENEIRLLLEVADDISYAIENIENAEIKKKTEDDLKENERLLISIVDNIPNMIFLKDAKELRFYRLNKAGEKLLGYTRQELEGKNDYDFFPKEQADKFTSKDREVIESGKHINIPQETINTKSGKKILHTQKIAINDIHGNPLYLLGISEDITERIEAEQKIIESEHYYRTIFETTGNATAIIDEDTTYSKVNSKFEEISGYKKEEIEGKMHWEKFVHKDDIELMKEKHRLRRLDPTKAERNYEFRFVDKTGNIRNVLITIDMIPGTKKSVASLLDITERKLAEKKVQESEKRYRMLFEHNPVPMLIYERTTLQLIAVNEAFHKHYGYNKEQIISMILPDLYPDEQKIPITELAKNLKGHNYAGEWKHLKADGTLIDIFATSHDIVFKGKDCRIAVVNDITERKAMENMIRKMNEELEVRVAERTSQLEESNKELEAFSYSVSHDLRAPLRAISGFSKLLKEDYYEKLDEEGKDYLEDIMKNSERMAILIDDLLELSRYGRKKMEMYDIKMKELFKSIINEQKEQAENKNTFFNLKEIPHIKGDYSLIKQVVINLISNAIKYSSKTPKPVIEIGANDKETEVVYYVKDNGVGFDMKYVHKLFGVFQRLHSVEEYEGTGVGLAIIQRIINKHNGKVWAESNPGKETVFYFSLPKI